jgi:hypothetical protein
MAALDRFEAAQAELADSADDGLTLACPKKDNRMVKPAAGAPENV